METAQDRIKRLHMRSMRRGMKEMDLIFIDYAKRKLAVMSEEEITLYDALLSENDQDIYQWVIGTQAPPARFAAMIADIVAGAEGIVAPAKM